MQISLKIKCLEQLEHDLNTTEHIAEVDEEEELPIKTGELPKRLQKALPTIKIGSGIEKTPFLKQFKGQNSCHEGDREKALSIMKNLAIIPSKELGNFKYIFNAQLREKYFQRLESQAQIAIKEEDKVAIGQISGVQI